MSEHLFKLEKTNRVVQSCHPVLKYSSPKSGKDLDHALCGEQTVVIGRDPACQIALDPTHYKGVSRRHAELSPIVSAGGQVQWQIHDLNSVNGVFVNGHRLQEPQTLQNGDRVGLGRKGVEFIFESQTDDSAEPTRNSDVPFDTVYEPSPASQLNSASAALPTPTGRTGFNSVKIMGCLVGVAAIFGFLNSVPDPQQQSQRPASPPASAPASPQPSQATFRGLTDVEFQGTELVTQSFDVSASKVIEDVPYTTPSGQEIMLDGYRFTVVAKSVFPDSEVDFTIRFYNAAGDEIVESEQIYYSPPPKQWTPGMQRVAVFLLPSDRTDLKVIQFSR